MNEMETIFYTNLRSKLKDRVKGKVYVKIENDILKLEILNGSVVYKQEYDDFIKMCMSGLDTTTLCKLILEDYSKFIKTMTARKFFK